MSRVLRACDRVAELFRHDPSLALAASLAYTAVVLVIGMLLGLLAAWSAIPVLPAG